MAKPVEFHFDFGSPNAYLSHKLVPGIEQRTGVKFTYVPVLLGGIFKATNNASPVVAFANVKNKPEYQRLEMQRFIEKHRLTKFAMNPHFPVNTLQIMRGAAAAEIDGTLPQYIEAVFPPMWETGKKMDDPAVIKAELDAAIHGVLESNAHAGVAATGSRKSRQISASSEASTPDAARISASPVQRHCSFRNAPRISRTPGTRGPQDREAPRTMRTQGP